MRHKSFDSSSVTTFEQAAAVAAGDAVTQIMAVHADGSSIRNVAGPLLSSLTGSVEYRPFSWEVASGHGDGLGGGGGRVHPDAPVPQTGTTAPGLSKVHKSPRNKSGGILEVYRNASFLELRCRSEPNLPGAERPGGERGEIEEFSAAARRRMLVCLAKVDDGAAPFMVGLTYPDEFDRYAWDGEQVKRHIDTISKRFARRFPDGCLMWKLEFQARKSGVNKGKIAPHIHAFVWGVPWGFEWKAMRTDQVRLRRRMVGPVIIWDEDILAGGEWVEGRSALVDEREGWGGIRVQAHGKCPSVVNGDSIANWFARNWYDVVGSGDVRHYRAGTSVQRLGSKRGAFAYAAKKYVAKTGECVWSAKPGRFWGIVGRKNLPLGRRDVLELTNAQALKLRRVMRRYRMATCPKEKRAKMRKGQLFSRDFTVKLFAGVEFWMERLPALLGSAPRLRQAGARRLFPLLI